MDKVVITFHKVTQTVLGGVTINFLIANSPCRMFAKNYKNFVHNRQSYCNNNEKPVLLQAKPRYAAISLNKQLIISS